MEDHYSINVAKRIKDAPPVGPYHTHHFRVELPGSTTKLGAQEILLELKLKYPEPEYVVDMTHWKCRGHPVPLKLSRHTP